MLDSNLYLYERMMAQRVKDEHRQAELRRLQREARGAHPDWLSRQRCWLLCQLGHLFVSLGVRLLQAGMPEPLPVGE